MSRNFIPYGKQSVDEADIQEVVEVLRSDWLTTGPKVEEFEREFAGYIGVGNAVAVNSGTAALHSAIFAIGLNPGEEVIVPAMTFVATANSVIYQGGIPVLVDIEPGNLLLAADKIEAKISSKTRAIIAVDIAGHPADYDALRSIADKHNLYLLSDSCHSLGAEYKGKKAGSLADLSCFSFHPVKHITTGEGGMVVTEDDNLARRMRIFRNHGISADFRQREAEGSWYYEMRELGYNYRLTDIQCALGISQLRKLPEFVKRRKQIALMYERALTNCEQITILRPAAEVSHSYHLYIIKLNLESLKVDRRRIFSDLRGTGIGVNVHYIPVHFHPYYQNKFGYKGGDFPVAEAEYERILSLPIFPAMTDEEVQTVIRKVNEVGAKHSL